MHRILLLAVVVSLPASCSKVESRSSEGYPCSTNPDDDPHFTCDPFRGLICMQNGGDGGYKCRLPCSNLPGECMRGDVCCGGKIFGKTYDRERGCTPRRECLQSPDGGGADGP